MHHLRFRLFSKYTLYSCLGLVFLFGSVIECQSQSKFRIGLSGGFGSTRLAVNPVVANGPDRFGTRFSTTVPLGLHAGWFKAEGFGFSTGLQLTMQEVRAGYGDRPGTNQGNRVLSPRNAVESIPRFSIPLMAQYRKSISQTMPLSMQFGAGLAVDFYDPFSGYSATSFGGFDTLNPMGDVLSVSQYEILRTVSASAKLEASIGIDFTRGSRLELGSVFSFGLQNIYEGDYYYFEDVNIPDQIFFGEEGDFEEFLKDNTPLDHYSFSSRGSYLVVYLRYWLPRLGFMDNLKKTPK